MNKKDYYTILGVRPSASLRDIKDAYRRLARRYHPDVAKDTDSSQVLTEVNEAYEVLSNLELRTSYDLERSNKVVTNLRQQVEQTVGDYLKQFELQIKPTH
jgi:curved DNA-binding protein